MAVLVEPQPIPDVPPLDCPECDGKMYLKRSRYGLFYGCENYPGCRATHGAHANGRPLGVPANSVTKVARISAHDAFDQLWIGALAIYDIRERGAARRKAEHKINQTARVRAYEWLADRLGVPFDDCHIGSFDLDTCRLVVQVCSGVRPRDVRRWAKARRETA